MSIDKTDWHADSLPTDLPEEAAATHMGMFVAWAVLNGHLAPVHEQESREFVDAVRTRSKTGRDFFLTRCDGKLTERDLTPEGVAFAVRYYSKQYFSDYERTLCGTLRSMYDVADTWDNYDRIAPVLTERFAKWQRRRSRPWWQFWRP